jgi:hypothetical protein
MVAVSSRRVAEHTPREVNERIRRMVEMSVAHYASHPDQIEQRLRELDEEWDFERIVETQSAGLSLAGLMLSLLSGRRRWLLLPLVVQGFMLQHALQGWCPPVPILRRLGVRTREEIDRERFALKALRGDFSELTGEGGESAASVDHVIAATDR